MVWNRIDLKNFAKDPSLEVSTIFFRSTNDILPLTNALK